MTIRRLTVVSLLVASVAFNAGAREASTTTHWPQFRGPGGAGLAHGEDLPGRWSRTHNVAWTVEIPGRGWSSPIVWGDRIFVTSALSSRPGKEPSTGIFGNDYIAELIEQGLSEEEAVARVLERDIETTAGREDDNHSSVVRWMVYGLDLHTGKILWRHEAHAGIPFGGRHRKNTYASETPVTDGKRVYVYFGNVGLFAYSLDGALAWSRRLKPHAVYLNFGTAASPALDSDHVYIQNDNEESSYLAAFDKETGQESWRTLRSRGANSSGWSSPFLWHSKERTEIVSVAPGTVISYDTRGQELWRLKGVRGVPAPTPLSGSGLLYVASGSPEEPVRPLFAIRPGAAGDITLDAESTSNEHVAWYQPKAGTYIPSPLVYQDRLYVLYDKGFLAAFGARTGKQLYKVRLERGADAFSSSPWAYDDKVFCLSEDGETFVIAAGDEFALVEKNSLDEISLATPAIAKGTLVIRTATRLYGIRKLAGDP